MLQVVEASFQKHVLRNRFVFGMLCFELRCRIYAGGRKQHSTYARWNDSLKALNVDNSHARRCIIIYRTLRPAWLLSWSATPFTHILEHHKQLSTFIEQHRDAIQECCRQKQGELRIKQ